MFRTVYTNKMTTRRRQIGFVGGQEILVELRKLDKIHPRSDLVWSLIHSYGLHESMELLPVKPATLDQLSSFHSKDYLSKLTKDADEAEDNEEFGLGYDCPIIPDVFEFVSIVGGASITAAEFVVAKTRSEGPAAEEPAPVAINWFGGWHHAQRDEASGFCYVNDIVLAIHSLRSRFDRVLYVDLDIHHGDGVENAFAFSPKVFTLSFHRFEAGFFPGTGDTTDIGFGRGKNFTLNVPLLEGIDDGKYNELFSGIFPAVVERFSPDAIVCQCGGDSLAQDPIGDFNLSMFGLGKCISRVLDQNLPTVFLGGGGYNPQNTAKYWTYLTSLICDTQIEMDIPCDDPFFSAYGPSFDLAVDSGMRKNFNSEKLIASLIEQSKFKLEYLKN